MFYNYCFFAITISASFPLFRLISATTTTFLISLTPLCAFVLAKNNKTARHTCKVSEWFRSRRQGGGGVPVDVGAAAGGGGAAQAARAQRDAERQRARAQPPAAHRRPQRPSLRC